MERGMQKRIDPLLAEEIRRMQQHLEQALGFRVTFREASRVLVTKKINNAKEQVKKIDFP